MLPWIEKYRPTKIADILFDDILRSKFNRIMELKLYPNLILMGNPGVGKTSTLLAFAKQVTGKYYNEAVLELNASDNRGLDYINSSVLYFCKKKISQDNELFNQKYIIFDEADNITKKAQNALANLMEQYSDNTKFLSI